MALDRDQWAVALLARLGNSTPDGATVQALLTWARAEGGGFGNVAAFNPLNTTRPFNGSKPINSVGVQAFTDDDSGLTATAKTIMQSNFAPIDAALKAGTTCVELGRIVGSLPWGTGDFGHLCPDAPPPSPAPPSPAPTTKKEDSMTAVVLPDGTVKVYAVNPAGHLLEFTRKEGTETNSVIDITDEIGGPAPYTVQP